MFPVRTLVPNQQTNVTNDLHYTGDSHCGVEAMREVSADINQAIKPEIKPNGLEHVPSGLEQAPGSIRDGPDSAEKEPQNNDMALVCGSHAYNDLYIADQMLFQTHQRLFTILTEAEGLTIAYGVFHTALRQFSSLWKDLGGFSAPHESQNWQKAAHAIIWKAQELVVGSSGTRLLELENSVCFDGRRLASEFLGMLGIPTGISITPEIPRLVEVSEDIPERKAIEEKPTELELAQLELTNISEDRKRNNKKLHQIGSLRSTGHQKSFQGKEINLLRRQRKEASRYEHTKLSKRSDQEIVDAVNSALGLKSARRDEKKRLRWEDQRKRLKMHMTEVCPRGEFDVEIVIQKYADALFSAILEEENDPAALDFDRLVLWTDGSKQAGGCNSRMGAAVVYERYRGDHVWVEHAWNIQGNLNINAIELFAIGEALEIAHSEIHNSIRKDESRRGTTKPPEIVVFTDSQAALKFTDSFRRFFRQELMDPATSKIIDMTESLKDMGWHVRLQWVPAHSGIRGNERADFLAKKAARYYELTKIKPPRLGDSGCQVRVVHNEENRWLYGRWGDSIRASRNEARGREFGRQGEFQLVNIEGDEEGNRQG